MWEAGETRGFTQRFDLSGHTRQTASHPSPHPLHHSREARAGGTRDAGLLGWEKVSVWRKRGMRFLQFSRAGRQGGRDLKVSSSLSSGAAHFPCFKCFVFHSMGALQPQHALTTSWCNLPTISLLLHSLNMRRLPL